MSRIATGSSSASLSGVARREDPSARIGGPRGRRDGSSALDAGRRRRSLRRLGAGRPRRRLLRAGIVVVPCTERIVELAIVDHVRP
jgi:hypothetical protein